MTVIAESEFAARIRAFNQMYGLPVAERPNFLSVQRLKDFKHTLSDELDEISDIIDGLNTCEQDEGTISEACKAYALVELADLLGDLQVYCASEMAKWGLPLDPVLRVIMDSNFSKLGADGLPIVDERGKVQKGPGYWKPEPKIAEFLQALTEQRPTGDG